MCIHTKWFGVFNYLCNYASQRIDAVWGQVNLKVSRAEAWAHSVINFSVPGCSVGRDTPINMQNSLWVPNMQVSVEHHGIIERVPGIVTC